MSRSHRAECKVRCAIFYSNIAESRAAHTRSAAPPPSRTASATMRYWNISRERHYRSSARCCWTLCVSVDRAAHPSTHTRGKPRLLDVGRRILARDRFAPDSPLEEAVSSELVSGKPGFLIREKRVSAKTEWDQYVAAVNNNLFFPRARRGVRRLNAGKGFSGVSKGFRDIRPVCWGSIWLTSWPAHSMAYQRLTSFFTL